MRPDLEDYEELADEGSIPRSRAMSWLVLVVAVGGFAALAYYAYHSGSQSVQGGQVVTIAADKSPIKGAPDEAGGEQFANKDKTIYDAIDEDNDVPAKAEKLLPEAESPVIPQPAVEATPSVEAAKPSDTGTKTFVNKNLATSEAPLDPVDAQSMKQGGPAIAPEAEPVKAAPAPVVVAKPVEKPAEKKAVEAKPASPATTAPKMVNVKPVAANGGFQIQLGAFKSEAEARSNWSKISGKNGDVLKGSPVVVKADLPNGTFYRLRAGGFATSADAKAACAKLSGRGQACFPVK